MIVNKPLNDSAEPGVVIIVLPGEPIAWARSRHHGGQHFTPVKQRNEAAALKIAARSAMRGHQLILGPVELDILAEFAMPKSWSRKRRAAEIENPSFPTKRPDYDNLAKLASDSLNGVVYRDDAQIVTAHIRKRYALAPRLVIMVAPLSRLVEVIEGPLKNPRPQSRPGSSQNGKTSERISGGTSKEHRIPKERHNGNDTPRSV